MPVLIQELKNLPFQELRGETLLPITEFIKYIRAHAVEGDKNIRVDNLKLELLKRNELRNEDEKVYITFQGILIYIGNHINDFSICKQIYSDICSTLLGKKQKTSESYSVLELYNEIARLVIPIPYSKLRYDEESLTTLFQNYKTHFSQSDGDKICRFEFQFSKKYPNIPNFEESLEEKRNYVYKLKHLLELEKDLNATTTAYISENKKRKEASDVINGVNVKLNNIIHTYDGLSRSSRHYQEFIISQKNVIIVTECLVAVCKTHNIGVHVFVELEESSNEQSFEDQATILRSNLHKTHGVTVPEVIFLKNNSLGEYTCKNCSDESFHKFHLRDDYFSRKLGNQICYISHSNDDRYEDVMAPDTIENKDGVYCAYCFEQISNYINRPLDWKQFDLLQEWYLEVLFELQIILSTLFLNKDSLRRSDCNDSFMYNRLGKLYCLLDSGLNILNRKYNGIIQQLNTELLIVNYHSVSTVFTVTGQSGATGSLKWASRWLQARSDVDKRYFDTFLKCYDFEYENVEKQTSIKPICMRDCHIILYLDNLVRLSMHSDPDPGKNRTSQICTLPITVKGLPKDALITETWHSGMCDMDENCCCKEQKQIGKEYEDLLFEYTEPEGEALHILDVQASLGVSFYVEDFDSLLKECQIYHHGGTPETHVSKVLDDLNASMQSIKLDDHGFGDEDESEIGLNDSMHHVTEDDTHVIIEQVGEDIRTDEFLDDILQEAEFMDGICPLDISKEGENLESFPEEDISNLSISDSFENSCSEKTREHSSSKPDLYFRKFQVPPLLCKHPTPAQGRDDDISHLKEILLDILTKLGRYPGKMYPDRILFAPDNKISKNLIQLMKSDVVFQQFLPEFPILHLKKSKITNLFSAYKEAGIIHLLKYMKDSDKEADWTDLVSLANIETAAKNIKRLALALHLAFFVRFIHTLPDNEQKEIICNIKQNSLLVLHDKWYKKLVSFMTKGKEVNATFALHGDIMRHCGEILGIGISERTGGREGYSLLLGCVKSSLPFAFLNGASSYASFCIDLLNVHYTAGHFHQSMKHTLFSTPHKDSTINFALDTQREMDHQDAIKGFRPRSTIDTVIPRMSIVDHFTEVQEIRHGLNTSELNASSVSTSQVEPDDQCTAKDKQINFEITNKDLKFIIPVAKLILRVGALSLEKDSTPRNVYNSAKPSLPEAILDKDSYSVGRFLGKKYACQQNIFGLTMEDLDDQSTLTGPKPLLQRLKTSKGITMRRSTIKSKVMTDDQKKEAKRVALVKKQATIADCISSEMNTCQALVKPDCSKASLQKSPGIKKALIRLISLCIPHTNYTNMDTILENRGLIFHNVTDIPSSINTTVKYATVEFAGVKFKTHATSGDEYLQHIEKGIIGRLLRSTNFPNLKRIVVCEEKYSFTPDDFKAATRMKRQKSSTTSITHLRLESDILSTEKMSKSAVIATEVGKRLISNYLARHVRKLDIKRDLILDVDSELLITNCCSHELDECSCEYKSYATPVRGFFTKSEGFIKQEQLQNIKQRKGEAEMAQVDWLADIQNSLEGSDAVVSIVTSADIDSLFIHLFAVPFFWTRNSNGKFKHKVYILLQKQKSELYDITGIAELLEDRFGHDTVSKLALSLCLGGNDFLPKYQGISHEKWITAIIETRTVLDIFSFDLDAESGKPVSGNINESIYLDIVKKFYCPVNLKPELLSIECVRQISIKPPGKDQRHPKSWMPPITALQNVVKLINCQIAYLLTLWKHDAVLPNFMKAGCLKKDTAGQIQYDFGNEVRVNKLEDLISINERELKSKMDEASVPSKRKRENTTPVKPRRGKKKPIMSTPIKMKPSK